MGTTVVQSLRVKTFALLAIATLGLGCSSATKVATYQNSYDFREARYEERCVVANPPIACTQAQQELAAYEKHLHEAAAALKHGGKFPLQLGAVKADEKAAKASADKLAGHEPLAYKPLQLR